MSKNIVFIHGMWARGCLLSNYKKFFEKKGYNCLTPDLPFHSKDSDVNNKVGDYGFLDFVDAMAEFVKKLDSKPVIMGHSMGGLITHKLAEMNLCKKAVLITPATQRGVVNINPGSITGFAPVLLKPFFWKKPLHPVRKGLDYICSEVPESLREKLFEEFVPESGRAFFEISMWAVDFSRSTHIDNKKIDCPVLQIAGLKDKIIPENVLQTQADLMSPYVKDFEFKKYEKHGHGIIWEKGWDLIAKDICQWIEKDQ